MSDIPTLHSQARKLILSVGSGISKLESGSRRTRRDAGNGASSSRYADEELQKQLQQLQKISFDLESLWRMQSMSGKNTSSMNIWKRRIDQIIDETYALERAMDSCNAKYMSWKAEEAQRQELLHRRNGMSVTNFDVEAEGKERIRRSKQVAEEAYQTGLSVLSSMAQQRDVLKSAHRKVLDVLNTIGMSDSVLRIAERRIAVDKLIAYGGMAVITLVLVILYYWYG
ncbi:Membrin-12 [Picochlorum sp. SENEW3]|nr:Membrin-12 [Picochlorum sp. SENEW3]